MSRRCHCSRVLELVQTDPRLLVLPLAVRGLFVALAPSRPAGEDSPHSATADFTPQLESIAEALEESRIEAAACRARAALPPELHCKTCGYRCRFVHMFAGDPCPNGDGPLS